MIQPRNSLLCLSIALLISLNLCHSKPTTSAGTNAIPQITLNELSPPPDKHNGVQIRSDKDSDYRKSYAAQMLSYMNGSVSPCHDFYEYACGNWQNVIEERMSTTKRNNILDIIYKLNEIVENILQKSHINDVAPEYDSEFQMAKSFYNNCLAAELYPMPMSLEYLAVLKEIGGFPALDANWNSDNFHWINMSAHLSNYGVNSFIKEIIFPEYPFPPYFKIPEFGFDINLHHDTVRNKSSNAYKENEKRIRNILTVYGVEKRRCDVIVSETFDFLEKILNVTHLFDEDAIECELFSNFMKDANIQLLKEKWRLYYDIAWLGKNFENVTKELEWCSTPCFFLYDKLNKICEANKKAAANYLSLKFLFHMDAGLKAKAFQKDFCISSIKSSMQHFFDHVYMKLHFNNELRMEINDIIKEIRQSLRLILQDANWLDESTRKASLVKEAEITEFIGRYEDANVSKLLMEELKKLEFVNGSYETNHLNLRKFKQYMTRFIGLNFEKFSKNTKPLELMVGMQPNSFYYNVDNSIYVMAATFKPPIYHRAWPNSLKFGTLGFIIGHELTHGFDTVGTNYNESGQERYWWSIKSAKAFKERSNCYVNHYEKYVIPEINRNINGFLTINENMADDGGLREAFMAYRRYIKKVTTDLEEEQLPGINLSPEQLLFLGFAQMWCASYKEADFWEELANQHVFDKYRVLGTLSNNEDFARAYDCPVGSAMNPSLQKCNVWKGGHGTKD